MGEPIVCDLLPLVSNITIFHVSLVSGGGGGYLLENILWKIFSNSMRMSDSEIVSHSPPPPGPPGTDTKGKSCRGIMPHPEAGV